MTLVVKLYVVIDEQLQEVASLPFEVPEDDFLRRLTVFAETISAETHNIVVEKKAEFDFRSVPG